MQNQSQKIIALLGPTNTGKTHVAIEKMLEFNSGIFGFPLRTNINGKIEIVQGIEINDFAKGKIENTTQELLEEKEAVKDLLS